MPNDAAPAITTMGPSVQRSNILNGTLTGCTCCQSVLNLPQFACESADEAASAIEVTHPIGTLFVVISCAVPLGLKVVNEKEYAEPPPRFAMMEVVKVGKRAKGTSKAD
jgi:NAD-dependent oxidoreductase involved in siderophore biosynthesis